MDTIRHYGEYAPKDVAKMQLRGVLLEAKFQKYILAEVPDQHQNRFHLSPVKIAFALGQYLNDLNRLTALHNVRNPAQDHFTEISRALGYMLKWIIVESPASAKFSLDEYKALDPKTQAIALRPNIYFIFIVILYMLGGTSIEDFTSKNKSAIGGLLYSIKKGEYSQKLGCTIFSLLEIKSQIKIEPTSQS